MKSDRIFINPFQLMGIEVPPRGFPVDELYRKPIPESLSLELGLPLMMAKILEMTRLLSRCLFSGSKVQMKSCEVLAREIHMLGKAVTRSLLDLQAKPDMVKHFVRIPFHLERIGDMLESILNCCRVRAGQGIPITAKACTELEQVFSVLLDMLEHLRDAFASPDKQLLEHVLFRSKDLGKMLRDFRSAHWARLAGGLCTPEGSSLYLDLFDSLKSINEYVEKISTVFLELGTQPPGDDDISRKTKKKRGRNGSP